MSTISTGQTPSPIAAINGPAASAATPAKGGFAALDQGDFLRLLLTQLQQQDPLEPVDNKEMLAQMAQFTALAGSTETNATLADISTKLDALIAVQKTAHMPADTPTADS